MNKNLLALAVGATIAAAPIVATQALIIRLRWVMRAV
jgi:hypothetical protein